ncbi:MAG: hypothetical protein H0T46_12340 [Deltaproteobacteria bacterium]|nr:hypothetical protein [Deltaproteobacteria bacterium]
MLDLVSTKLAFARDARQLLVIHDDHVAWHATSGDTRRLPIAGVHAIAAFGDQLWTVGPCGLERWSFLGRRIGSARAMAHDTAIAPVFAGPPALVCGSRLWLDDCETLREVELADGAMPFLGRRAFTVERVRGGRVVRLGSATWALPQGAVLVGGAALFDGAGVALFVSRGDRIEAWSSTATGEVRHCMALPTGRVRLAARRGLAIVHAGDQLTAFDLRYGKELGIGVAPADDLALDPDGKFLATLHGGEVRITTLDDAFAEHDHRRMKQMEDLEQLMEDTEAARTLTSDGLDALDVPDALAVVNDGIDVASDLSDGDYSAAAGSGMDLAADSVGLAEDLGYLGEGLGGAATTISGEQKIARGYANIAADDFDGKACDGWRELLEGGGQVAEGTGGLMGEGAGDWVEAAGKGLQYGLHIGDALAPHVYGEEIKGQQWQTVPEDGVWKASTGNSVVDWMFGVGE